MLTLFGFEGIRFFVYLRVCSLKTAQKKKKYFLSEEILRREL